MLRAEEFTDEVERDFSIRSLGQLQVTNLRGSVEVKGWALDKIRVRAKRRVSASNEDESRRLLSMLDFRYRAAGGDIELSAQYGKGLDVEERVRERKESRASMDMIVYAPASLKLQVWSADGQVDIKDWKTDVQVRTNAGKIRIADVSAKEVSLFCVSCSTEVRKLKASLRSIGGSGSVQVENVSGRNIFIETESGNISLKEINGKQLYISRSGKISGLGVKGQVEFYSRNGDIELQEIVGYLSGRTLSGSVSVSVRDWKFDERALIESTTGNISVSLPARFYGEADVHSIFGEAEIQFPYQRQPSPVVYGPEPRNRIQGIIGKGGKGGDQIRIFSQTGNVQLLRTL